MMMVRLTSLLVSVALLVPVAGLADTMITAPSLANKTPGPDFRIGTADDGTQSGNFGPNLSGPNVRGAASFLLLKSNGSIPANGDDFDYIIFFDGNLDLTLDMLASTATTAVMNITGGNLQTTPEFTPGRTGGMLTGVSGMATFNLNDGSASAKISGQFADPAFMTAIMDQGVNAGAGMSVIVMRPSFGASGNAYVDTVLTPLVPASAGEITFIEFMGTVNVACCMNFGMRGVFALYRTEGSSTTTTTLPGGGGGCTDLSNCGTALHNALPPTDSPDKKVQKTAKKLGHLAETAKTKFQQATAATGKKQKRLYKSARSTLMKLLSQAKKADQKGRLGVPLAPLEAAVNGLLALIPSS